MADAAERLCRLARAYGLSSPRAAGELPGGMFLRPLILEADEGKYVVRGHTFRRSAATFRFQAETTNAAADAGVPCPRVLRRLDGRWGEARDDAFWALHEYADGAPVAWPDWQRRKRDPGFLEDLGAWAASVHNVLACLRPAGSPALSLKLPPIRFHRLNACAQSALHAVASLEQARSRCPRTVRALKAQEIAEAWRLLLAAAARLRPSALPRQVVHGDISPVNLVWRRGVKAPTLIDWDCAHIGLRLYDALGDVLLRAPVNVAGRADLDLREVAAYVRGYAGATAHPLTTAERECIPLFLLARQLEDLRQRAAVAPQLSEDRDEEYAALIAMRVDVLRQLAPFLTGEKGPGPWM